MECPVCIEKLGSTTKIKLACGHYVCESCLKKWTSTSLGNKMTIMTVKKGKPFHTSDNQMSFMLSINDQYISCPLCRTQYSTDFEKLNNQSKPTDYLSKILYRVWFKNKEDDKLSICHHIHYNSDLKQYIPLYDINSARLNKPQSSYTELLLTLFDDIIDNPRDLHVCVCNCCDANCPKIIVVPVDLCQCENHATPAELYDHLISFKPPKH